MMMSCSMVMMVRHDMQCVVVVNYDDVMQCVIVNNDVMQDGDDGKT